MSFADSLHRASWRGVPFGVELGQARYGRRKARHDYPYRDTVWLEDQGKLPAEFRLIGFLISNSAVYGGGSVKAQVARMKAAAEASGSGILVHPTRGSLAVDLAAPLVITERWDEGEVAEVEFLFVQAGRRVFPTVAASVADLVGKAAGLADAAGLGDFVAKVADPLAAGLDAVASIGDTAGAWLGRVQDLARDATGLYGTLAQLGGADFGRYFNGRNSGFLAGLASPYSGAGSIGDLIGLGSANRAAVTAAATAVTDRVAKLGAGATTADVAASAQAAVGALKTVAADPQDAVRMLADLAGFVPPASSVSGGAAAATSDLFRRAAASALARASAAYAPSSADDAHAVRGVVLAPIEAEIAAAGEAGADPVFAAFRGLRQAVVRDLGERGGALARLGDLSFDAALPSVVLAQRQYRDATREGELVTQADPIHPWFMPLAFRALTA